MTTFSTWSSTCSDTSHADDRLRDAQAAVDCAEEAATANSGDPALQTKVAPAQLWRERVLRWCGLQREALRADAVPVPGAPDRRWLHK